MIKQEFMAQHGVYEQGRNNLGDRIFEAWQDMRGSTRRLIRENPSEARILFYVLLSDLIVFTSWCLKTTVAPTTNFTKVIPLEIAIYLVLALFVRTACMFLSSIIMGSAARLAGGTGSWRETRAATFWGCLVAAPIGFMIAAFSICLSLIAPSVPSLPMAAITTHLNWVAIIPFVWFIAAGLAAMIAVAAALVALYLKAQGLV